MSLQPEDPFVRVVLLNYNGGELILRAVAAAAATEWPQNRIQIVCVDNGSSDGSVDEIASKYPDVHIVRNGRNLGFPGNNVAMEDLEGVDYVALVNSDAFVEPNWLRKLVTRAEADRTLGAVCPKILFTGEFVGFRVDLRGTSNSSPQMIRLRSLTVNGRDEFGRCHVARGGGRSSDSEGIFEWIADGSILRFPIATDFENDSIVLKVGLQIDDACEVTIGGTTAQFVGAREQQTVSFVIDQIPQRVAVLNNVGSWIDHSWTGHERGLFMVDDGEFDRPMEVGAWCGAAVLLRSSMLEDIGLFDDAYFLYYEDTDLAVRGRERGWRYMTEPTSRVFHDHSSSTVEGSELAAFHIERNRLMFAVRHAPSGVAINVLWRFLLVTASYTLSELRRAVRESRRFDGTVVFRRLHSLFGFVRELPNALRVRKSLSRRRLVSDRELAEAILMGGASSGSKGD
ncbi:MAG: glycosyltransferase family 2 protein [Actinomycetes bacterium]